MDWPANSDAILNSVRELFDNGKWWYYSGSTLRDFERRFAEWHDHKYGVGVCNGTVPLGVVLAALELGQGDKIILPAYNYFPLPRLVTSGVITPVFVDVCYDNPTISVEKVAEALEDGVKAVLAVYLDGCVPEMDALSDLCRNAGIYLIEDCAQATGAKYDGKRAGSWGDAGLFSFGGVKLMTCGQGGMVTTSDEELYERCFAVANRGFSPKGGMNPYGQVGENYGLSELSAAVLIPQLEILEDLCSQRESMMKELDRFIASLDGLIPMRQFQQTELRAQFRYSFRFDTNRFKVTRDELVGKAREQGIPIIPGFDSVTDSPRLFGQYKDAGDFPNARLAQESTLGIDHISLVTKGVDFWKDALQRLQMKLSS